MYRLGHLSDSVTLLRKALEFNQREPVSYFTMGTNLVAMKNITGAIEFFNYALFLDPEYIEPFHSLFINKCTLLRQKANKPLPMDTNQDIHMFWEKAWKVIILLKFNIFVIYQLVSNLF
jgi:tetratricopeptide (TPR) repeat protein